MRDRAPLPSPEYILDVGTSFRAAKTLLAAIELDVFTALGEAPATLAELEAKLGLHPRSSRDFLDALVALGFLGRSDGVYENTPPAAVYLDRKRDTCIAALLEMADRRLYRYWDRLPLALRSGEPQNELRDGGATLFDALAANPQRHRLFLSAMTALSRAAHLAIARKFPWSGARRFADIGCAQGDLSVQLACAHPQLEGIGFDLPAVEPFFAEHVARYAVGDRVRFVAGDFFVDPLPDADVLVMGHVLHDWSLDEKRALIARAHEALPVGGSLVIYEAMIDDARESNAQGLLMSLTMLLETRGGFDYTAADCIEWLREAGFRNMRRERLPGAETMVIGTR
ncbi:MAG: methyltransferase [Burkholderiaceae bacterium]